MFQWKASFLGLMAVLVASFAPGGEAIPNWPAPATWTPTRSAGLRTLADITSPSPFIGVTPCRIADTRGNGFAGAYGPPALVANANRDFAITGRCGIPGSVQAVSFNFAALDVGGAGDLRVFPAGGSTPLVSTLNYNGNTPNIANAAVVALGAGGAITVRADAVPINLVIDVNGYYTSNLNTDLFLVGEESGGGIVSGVNNAPSGLAYGVLGEAPYSSSGIGVYGISPGTGVRGDNSSTSSFVNGVEGVIISSSPGGFSAGVRGINNGTGGSGIGVYGSQAGSGWGVYGTVSGSGYGVLGSAPVSGNAVEAFGNFAATGSKAFIEPHPTDASKVIRYISLEGPESGTYFRGSAQIVNGSAVIYVPEDFRVVTDSEGLTVQLTPVGGAASMFVVSEDLNQIVVRSSRDVRFHYMVNGVRRAFKDHQAIADGTEFVPRSSSDRMPSYLTEEARRRLIANGTYNPDGTVNMETAQRLGWAKEWSERNAREQKTN